jgi:hypothetical protein
MQKWFKRHKLSTRLGVVIGFIGFVASVSDLQQRFFPKGITMPTIPHFNPNWIFWSFALALLVLVYYREQKQNKKSELQSGLKIELETVGSPFKDSTVKEIVAVVVCNNGYKVVEKVKCEILGISPIPKTLQNPKFPVNLPARDATRIINPGAKLYFEFLVLEARPELRSATFIDENGNKQSFYEDMHDMIKAAAVSQFNQEYYKAYPSWKSPDVDNAYFFELQISTAEPPLNKKKIRLKFLLTQNDSLNLLPIGGFFISIV